MNEYYHYSKLYSNSRRRLVIPTSVLVYYRWRTSADEPKRSLFSFICKKIKEEGYTIPFVITFTYTLFVILPGGVRIVCFITKHDTSFNIAHTVWTVTYRLNTFSDTCIYLFCDRDIQKYLKNKFRRNRVVCNSTQNNGTKNDDKGGNVKKITTDIWTL